jgi:hypothetical protein
MPSASDLAVDLASASVMRPFLFTSSFVIARLDRAIQ